MYNDMDEYMRSLYKPSKSTSDDDFMRSLYKGGASTNDTDDFMRSLYNPEKAMQAFRNRGYNAEVAQRREDLGEQIGNYGSRLESVGQEVPAYQKGLNAVLKVIGALDKPRAALWGGVVNALDGDDATSFGQGMKEGWTGEKVYTGTDLMKYLFGEAETKGGKFAQGLGGFVAEAALDPLTYLSTGVGSLAKGFLTGAGKSMTKGAATKIASGLAKEVTQEGAEAVVKQGFKRAGQELSEAQLARYARRVGAERANKVLSEEIGGRLGKNLSRTAETSAGVLRQPFNVSQIADETKRLLQEGLLKHDNILNAGGKGLAIGAGNSARTIGGLTNAKMQDAGAAAAQWVRNKTGAVGQVFGGVQDWTANVFKPSYIKGMDNESQYVMKFFRDRMKGSLEGANQALQTKTNALAKTLKDTYGIEGAREKDRMITDMLEGTLVNGNADETIKEIVNTMRSDFKAMGMTEQQIGALHSSLLDEYFPHVKSWEKQLEDRTIVKGGVNKKFNITNPAGHRRMFGNDVHAANTAILFRSSTEAARDDFFKALGQAAPDKAVKELIEKTKGTPAALGAIRDALGADTFDRVAKDTLDGMEDYFETSALSAYISRGLSHNKILAEKDFMDNVLASFGEQVNERGIRTAIDNGEDVIIPKSSLKIYGLNIGEYIRDKKTAKSMAQKVKQANTELGDWEKMLKDVDARISSAWSTGGKQGGDDVAALVKEKMDIMTEIDNAKAAADAAIDSQTFEELPKDLVSLIARIADSEGDDLVRLSDKDADVVMKYAGKFFPIEAYKMPGGAIDFMNTSLGNQKKAGFEALTRVIDRIHQMWKPTVTGLQPAFHIRNAVGSTALNMLDIGFKTADPRINAIASKAARGLDEVVEVGGHKIKASEISNLMVANNAFATGQVTDIDALSKSYMSGITDIAAPQKAGVGKVWKTATDAGMKVTDTVESQVRGVNFIAHLEDALEKGVSLKEAAAYAGSMVQKYHFDYTDLTDIERQVFKRIMPFYTFTRKNLPLQLEELLNKPRVAAYLDTWNDNMEQSYGVDSANMPNWMQSQMALAMPFLNAGDGRTAYANISLPMADVTSLGSPKEAMNKALGMITPIAKAPLELSMNRTMLSGAPIWRNEGEKNAEILKYILSQNGLLRSAQSFVDNVNPEDPLAERPLENITQIPGIGKLIRGYNEEAGQEQAMYEYNRQLGNEVQYLKSRGVNVPDTNTAELLGYLDAAVTEQFKRTGQLTDTQKIRAQGRRSTANNALPKMPTYDPQAMMEKLKRSIY